MESLAAQIMRAIENDNLILPTLPEIALRIRRCEQDPNLDVISLAHIIEQDPATTAQLLRIANSPLVRREVKVADLSKAISLLGIGYCAKVAVSLSTKQLFNSKNPASAQRMRDIWKQSLDVACHCYVLAGKVKLIPEEAFLAGLLHKIGALPIIAVADKEGNYSEEELNLVIKEIHPMLGESILNHWQFPRAIADIPQNFRDHHRYVNQVDLCDLVTISENQTQSTESKKPWSDILAIKRFGWEDCDIDDEFKQIDAEIKLAHDVFEY